MSYIFQSLKVANIDDPISRLKGFTFKLGKYLLSTKPHNVQETLAK